MRQIVIVLTDLYLPTEAEDAAPLPRRGELPGIDEATRFGTRTHLASGWRDWLAATLGRQDLVGVAPARIAGSVLPQTPLATSWLASPVHLSAGFSQVRLDHRGLLRLMPQESAALAAAFAGAFAGSGLTLAPLPSGDLLLCAPGTAAVATTEPARVAGGEIAPALPQGAKAAALRRTAAEIEMWLHAQPLNAARAASAAPPVNALWLWGAGGRDATVQPRAAGSLPLAFGADAYLHGLWHLQGGRCQPAPADLAALPEHAAAVVLALAVADELRRTMTATLLEALRALDARFIGPALVRLRRGELERVTFIANDTAVQLRRRSVLKRWRRARAGLGSLA